MHENQETAFIERLAKLRYQKGVSARDMSLSLGQSTSYIANIENGHSLPSLQAFFYICEYFDITPSDFFDDKKAPYPHLQQQINEEMEALDEDALLHLLGLLKALRKK